MTSDLPNLPEFPNPPAFPAPKPPAEILADFLHDLFEAGVASVVDPLAPAPGQHWRVWADGALRTPVQAATAAPSLRRPTLQAALEGAYQRLLLELPRLPAGQPPAKLPPIQLPVAVEAARRLYQVCQVLAAPQQDKDEMRKSFTPDFRPTDVGAFLSTFATWRYLPMVWDHVRQRLTIATGATLAMQELERLIREQLALWPWPLRSVLAMEITPDAGSLGILEREPVARRYLAEQLLTQAVLAPSTRLAAWLTDSTPGAMRELLGGLQVARVKEPLTRSFGEIGAGLIRDWERWLAQAEQ